MTHKKRVGIVLNILVYDKLQLVAGRYGMTVNSLMAYILGQWSDSFSIKEKMTDKVVQEMTSQVVQEMTSQAMDFESNPIALEFVKKVFEEVVKKEMKELNDIKN